MEGGVGSQSCYHLAKSNIVVFLLPCLAKHKRLGVRKIRRFNQWRFLVHGCLSLPRFPSPSTLALASVALVFCDFLLLSVRATQPSIALFNPN
jgi:hypothetical protein